MRLHAARARVVKSRDVERGAVAVRRMDVQRDQPRDGRKVSSLPVMVREYEFGTVVDGCQWRVGGGFVILIKLFKADGAFCSTNVYFEFRKTVLY